MASHKNQHFVPRCYLKPFSLNGEGLAINLYNIDRRMGVPNAAVKGQCSGNYFYGEDLKLERVLQRSESWYGETVSAIGQPGFRLAEEHKAALRHFCYLQHCRTDAAARRSAESMSAMLDLARNGSESPKWQISRRDAILAGIHAFATSMDVVRDLKVCLVRNQTPSPFITSDDPAILTNRWYAQSPKTKGMTGGSGNAGVLFFLPLTPAILCLIYDGDVYSIPNEGGWVQAHKPSDIDAFNEHQFLNCWANIYFADWATLPSIHHACEMALPHRPAIRHQLVTAVLDSQNEFGKRYRVVPHEQLIKEGEVLVHVKSIQPNPRNWPSIIKWRPNPKVYSNGSGTGFVRRSRAEQGTGYERVP